MGKTKLTIFCRQQENKIKGLPFAANARIMDTKYVGKQGIIMRIALVGCAVMNREVSTLVAQSPNIIRVWWLRQGLHNTPDLLRTEVQKTIDEIEKENESLEENLRFEVVVLGYGLCSNGVIGLRSRTLPLVVPRCDDCFGKCREHFGTVPDGLNNPLCHQPKITRAGWQNIPKFMARIMRNTCLNVTTHG